LFRGNRHVGNAAGAPMATAQIWVHPRVRSRLDGLVEGSGTVLAAALPRVGFPSKGNRTIVAARRAAQELAC